MKKIQYEHPEAETADYGEFVSGASLPGGDGDNDQGTGDL